MPEIKHDDMVAAVKASWIALRHTLGTGQEPGFSQMREAHREVVAQMYDNLIAFHRPKVTENGGPEWRQTRLNGEEIVYRAQTITHDCGWSQLVWPDEEAIRMQVHMASHAPRPPANIRASQGGTL
jgi:hypothetical protein